MFSWEPEGRYCHRLCTAIAPFWFSMVHCWIMIMPFCLSTDRIWHSGHSECSTTILWSIAANLITTWNIDLLIAPKKHYLCSMFHREYTQYIILCTYPHWFYMYMSISLVYVIEQILIIGGGGGGGGCSVCYVLMNYGGEILNFKVKGQLTLGPWLRM